MERAPPAVPACAEAGPPVGVVLRAPRLPDPLEALARLGPDRGTFLRLAAGPGFRGTPFSVLATDPVEVLRIARLGGRPGLAERLAPLRGPRAPDARRIRRHGPRLPFAGGWAGTIGYEARSGIEERPAPRRPPLGFPAVWLGRYEALAAWNERTGERFLAGLGPTRAAAAARARTLGRALTARSHAAAGSGTGVGRAPRPARPPEAFREVVSRARAAILQGEIFQANVSQRFDARVDRPPQALFARLAASRPAPYMTFLDLGGGRAVLSASPERFLRVRGRVVETDPMKGTRPRGATQREDRALRRALESSPKERAELAMIVDLARNDLARVCAPGTVRVSVPRRLLRFPGVHQAIAVVRGRLADGRDAVDAVVAAFPPGSVTGAPKVRAMEVIDALEGEGRGPYCGALGWFDAGGDADLAVAIRTILVAGHRASYRVGGGITVGSDPRAEWLETLDKGRGLHAVLGGAGVPA